MYDLKNRDWEMMRLLDMLVWGLLAFFTTGEKYLPIILFLAIASMYFNKPWQRSYFDGLNLVLILLVNLTPEQPFWYSAVPIYPLVLASINNVIIKVKLMNYYNMILFLGLSVLSFIRLHEYPYIMLFMSITTPVIFTTILVLNTLLKKHVTLLYREAEYRDLNQRVSQNVITYVSAREKVYTVAECFKVAGLKCVVPNEFVKNHVDLIYKLSLINQIFNKENTAVTFFNELGGLRVYIKHLNLTQTEATILKSIGVINEEYFQFKVIGLY